MNAVVETNALEEIIQLVSFNVDKEEYGVDILKVQEINRVMDITEMPNSPDYIEGVVNLRSRIIPVVNLRLKLGLPKVEYNHETRIIVVDLNGKIVGFLVDKVREVLRIPYEITEIPPEMALGKNTEFITSVAKLDDRLLILLDLDKVINHTEIPTVG